MSQFYRIKGLPGLDGLFVEGTAEAGTCKVEVRTLINANAVVGDRTVKFPLPPGALWVGEEYVVPAQDPTKEFSTENPFGQHLYEGRFLKDEIEVVTVVYENATTVTIIEKDPTDLGEPNRTLYTQNFFQNRNMANELVVEVLHGKMDVEDLIFSLKELESKDF